MRRASAGWDLTGHVCRACLGRVLRRDEAGVAQFRCADCGAVGYGSVERLCACGAKLRTGHNAGLRCRPNPDAGSAEAPPEIVVAFVGFEGVARRRAPVGSIDATESLF